MAGRITIPPVRWGFPCGGIVVAFFAAVFLASEGTTSTATIAPRLTYTLQNLPPAEDAEGAGSWRVQFEVEGLRGDAPLFALSEWGGWTGDPWPYLEIEESEPAVRPREGTRNIFELEDPDAWRSKARITYRLRVVKRGSEAHARLGLLPTRCPDYVYGYSWNTLLRVERDGAPVEGKVTLELLDEEGGDVVTGWAGRSPRRQKVELDSIGGNSPLAFGTVAHGIKVRAGGIPLEVRQFGAARDITPRIAEILQGVMPALVAHTGRPLSSPYRAFVTDTQGGGMGSHYGLRIGFMAEEEEGHEHSPWFATHVTHELIHEWLGIRLHETDSSLVWFKEGFAEYFAMWEATAAALVTRGFFAERMMDLESIARERSSIGQVAFADPEVTWRDGDGPNETLAYTGAPLLAFALDAELRAAGRPGLLQLLRDLLGRESEFYSPDDLRTWFEEEGLADRYARSVAGTEMPEMSDVLVSVGYERAEEEVPLTYFGLRCEDVPYRWKVLAVDPEGPAAAAGIQVGDVINGYYPTRATVPVVRDAGTEYDFGLTRFEPGIEGTYVGVYRGEEELKVLIQPRLVPGGYVTSFATAGDALDDFFVFTPR